MQMPSSESSAEASPMLGAMQETMAIGNFYQERQEAKRSASLHSLYSNMTQEALREYFHLPLHSVAQKFGMCTTAFKKMCRRLGVAKWPHRQLRGIDKKIAALKAELQYSAAADKQQFLSGLSSLELEKFRISSGLEGQPNTPPPSVRIATEAAEVDAAAEHSQSDSSQDRRTCSSASNPKDDEKEAPSGLMITEQMLRQHFHLPLHAAAERFGICTTALKKLCRRAGIAKWPHRQLKGIDKKIASLRTELNYTSGDHHGCSQSIEALEHKKGLLSGLAGSPAASPSLPPRPSGPSQERRCMSPGPAAADGACQEEARSHRPPVASALDLLAAVAGEVPHREAAAAAAAAARCGDDDPPAGRSGVKREREEKEGGGGGDATDDCRQARLSNLVHSGDPSPPSAAAAAQSAEVRMLVAAAAAAEGPWAAMLLGIAGGGAGRAGGRSPSPSGLQSKCNYGGLPAMHHLRGPGPVAGPLRATMSS